MRVTCQLGLDLECHARNATENFRDARVLLAMALEAWADTVHRLEHRPQKLSNETNLEPVADEVAVMLSTEGTQGQHALEDAGQNKKIKKEFRNRHVDFFASDLRERRDLHLGRSRCLAS